MYHKFKGYQGKALGLREGEKQAKHILHLTSLKNVKQKCQWTSLFRFVKPSQCFSEAGLEATPFQNEVGGELSHSLS